MTGVLVPARTGSAEIEVSRSRFLGVVARVADEAEARAGVATARGEHHDARHHCSAFVIGPDRMLERAADDGEPAGTAGAPMLEVLRGAGVTDVVAVVTRWFGGTLLGAGGLVRAYGDATRAAFAAAGTRRRVLLTELEVRLDHADAGRVESALRDVGTAVLDVSYGADVALRLGARPDGVERARALVAGLTAGAADLVAVDERWVDERWVDESRQG